MDTKAKLNQLVAQTGSLGVFNIDGEDILRIVVEDAGPSNTLVVSARLIGQDEFIILKEIVGPANEKVRISTYEEAKIECTVFDSTGVAVKVIAASFNEASGSAIQIDVPAGDSINEIEVLTLTSSDNSVVITGDNATKSIDLKVNLNLDDVQEYPSLANFPAIGQSNTLYVALDTEKIYRFSGSIYIEVSPSPVTTVNGQTGDVVLVKSDVGLSNVDNTSDADKPISTATQLALNTKQDSLGFTPEDVANKSDDSLLGTSSTLYPTQKAVKEYVDSSIAAGSAPDATSTTKGILKLTGDLGGTADSPTVPGLASKYDASNPAGFITLAEVPASPVTSVNTQTGDVVLDKSDVGLSNVDNTSDLDKPISTATQTALNSKYDTSNPAGYITLAEVPASAVTSVNTQTGDVVLTKTDVGLSNVDNTSDLNKPISTATQTALNGKQDSLGFTPENVANKSTDTNLGNSNTLYPSQNAVKVYVDNSVAAGSAPDATTLSKGIIQLSGDLGGTATSPTVPALATKQDTLVSGANIKSINGQSIVGSGDLTVGGAVDSVNGQTGVVVLDKSDVGLSNADNTSDLDKPISTATQTALNSKYDASNPAGYITLAEVPANTVTSVNTKVGAVVLDKTDIGLSNVDNTSDLNKPISTAAQTALNAKQDTLVSATNIKTINGQSVLGSGDLSVGGTSSWGAITGTLSNQVDLQTVLNSKESTSNKSTDIALGTSDSLYPTQNAVKVYVDNAVAAGGGAVQSVNSQTGIVVLTKSDIGLSNVDNTSDANKPISTAVQTALNAKANTDLSNLSNVLIPNNVNLLSASTSSFAVATNTASTGNTGQLLMTTGQITAGTGNSGRLVLYTGWNSGTGSTGVMEISSGVAQGAGSSGSLAYYTGKSGTGLSGGVGISTGSIDSFQQGVNNETNTSGTGFIQINTGIIRNTASTNRTGTVFLGSGGSNSTLGSGAVTITSGAAASTLATAGNSGSLSLTTGSIVTAGSTGSTGGVFINSGTATNSTGASGGVVIRTGNTSTGTSGSIDIETGTSSGTRGDLRLRAKDIWLSGPNNFGMLQVSDFGIFSKNTLMVNSFDFSTYLHAQYDNPNFPAVWVTGSNHTISKFASVGALGATSSNAGGIAFKGAHVQGTVDGTYTAGDLYLESTSASFYNDTAANLSISSGKVVIQSSSAFVKGSATNANSGNVELRTGFAAGTGSRGRVIVDAPEMSLQGNSITNASFMYFGDPNIDGTWRIRPNGANLVTERRESGVWVVKQTITP